MSNENFNRQYRLAFGKGGSAGTEIGETSDACPVPLHITFSLEKSDLETQNTGKIEVWNLSKEHLAQLEEKDCAVALRAGYGNRLSLIFAGVVSTVETEVDGSDRKTSIEIVDNLVEIRDTYVSVCYADKVGWRSIFDDVAQQMGVAISYSYNAEFSELANGFSFVGKARDVLSKGCSCCGLSWSIQNGVVQVKKIGDVMSREVYVLSAETGLLGIPVRFTESEKNSTGTSGKSVGKQSSKASVTGWKVDYFLNGAINIDDYVKLESSIVTGYFRVYSISFDGDSASGDWICTAKLKEVKSS